MVQFHQGTSVARVVPGVLTYDIASGTPLTLTGDLESQSRTFHTVGADDSVVCKCRARPPRPPTGRAASSPRPSEWSGTGWYAGATGTGTFVGPRSA